MASTMPAMADESSAHSAAQLQSVTPSYRRNGKLFSCEPCRRGKLRCDHSSPVCGRCARRGKEDQCIYHPAPLTKPRTDPPGIGPHRTAASTPRLSTIGPYPTPFPSIENKRNGLVSPPSSNSTQQGKDAAFRVSTSQPASLGQGSVLPSPTAPMPPTPGEESKHSSAPSASYASPESAMSFIRDGRTGFLGPTSYSAVYTENSSILQTPDVEDPPDLPSLPADKIQQGAEVLSMFRDLPVYRNFTQRWFELCDGIVVLQPVFRIWIDELWNEFGKVLAEGNSEQMRSLSELVWRNTRRPMRVHGSMTAREWAKSASGRNLRWEVVGVVLSLVGLIAVNLSNWDTIFDSIRERYVDRATFAERMRKASEYCLCFCYESEVLNDIYVCFMFEDLVLVECLKGDAHYAAWQRTGEVCDAIVAMGLHQGNRPGPECPFFLAELRKKIFISAYGHDKVVATFLGRPPRLSHRYCKMEYPLDLSDDQLFSEGAELEAALSTLDQDGWNTQGCLNRTTWLRVWFQHCRIREDILEIALGSDDEDIERRAQEVRQKMDHLHRSAPAHIQITPEQILSDTSSPLGVGLPLRQKKEAMRQVNAMFVLCIHTGIIHTEFLLQRALTIRTRTDTKKLIPIARRMLKLVLLAQSRRDFFRDFQGDIVYLLALHGLPAAGVLAVELLIESQTRQYAPEVLPRSETIQDLSVFISALGSVGPGEGNHSICNQGRKALARVLDQILSPNPPPPVSTTGEQPIFDDSSVFFPIGNDADFLSWLEHVEWDKNNWIDQPPASMPGATEPPV
ncbi:uncharacterized protein MYCFIDRAFT_203102 [Pseudocercospora fijiensis CIRAD86]|uniref:Zn(2)-C6 fungal-type domain-containing protein n=1 Tax=Pseudocercospora fijiensis (strain CIRAD86) TaxID=383855 RepID=M3AJ69_PSEFD|nr:uncharacterized protein MYCFIDRAFT_203102 [Pseudocercospora fijiensis CIRAD86]EME84636.1 hypothetical protein MYCFIDRAFT_203102 [Pseudocercospora fijiensis CIRAD86]